MINSNNIFAIHDLKPFTKDGTIVFALCVLVEAGTTLTFKGEDYVLSLEVSGNAIRIYRQPVGENTAISVVDEYLKNDILKAIRNFINMVRQSIN